MTDIGTTEPATPARSEVPVRGARPARRVERGGIVGATPAGGTIAGGTKELDLDVHTEAVNAGILSTACGDKQGGDIYYMSLCSNDNITRVAVADMRGHGASVNHLSQWLYKSLEERIDHPHGAGVLEDLNALVCDHGFDAITTAAVVTYHSPDCCLHYSYAGHPPIFVTKSGAGWAPQPIDTDERPANMPLGIMRDVRYDVAQITLTPGDRVFLYTDGIVECANAEGEFYGEERLLQVLEETSGLDLAGVKYAVFESLRAFAGGDLTQDDCTVLILEIHNPEAC